MSLVRKLLQGMILAVLCLALSTAPVLAKEEPNCPQPEADCQASRDNRARAFQQEPPDDDGSLIQKTPMGAVYDVFPSGPAASAGPMYSGGPPGQALLRGGQQSGSPTVRHRGPWTLPEAVKAETGQDGLGYVKDAAGGALFAGQKVGEGAVGVGKEIGEGVFSLGKGLLSGLKNIVTD